MPIYAKEKKLVDLSKCDFSFSISNKIGRVMWNISYLILFRPFNLDFFKGWRAFVLRQFGAKVGANTSVCASVKIWAPWNLEIGDFSSIGPKVDCYNQGKIKIGNHTIISQKTYLCASTHDHLIANYPLICKPIEIKNQVWIAADAFIGPGVTVEEGAVIGARTSVFKDVEPWVVVGGNPAKFLKKRSIKI